MMAKFIAKPFREHNRFWLCLVLEDKMPFAETVAALLAAHLLGDFVFQPDWLVKAKGNTRWGLLVHVAIVLAISGMLLGNFSWQMLTVIGLSHLILDAIKVFALPKVMSHPDGPWPFAIDQLAHFAFIIVVAGIWPSLFTDGWWEKHLLVTQDYDVSNWYMGATVLLSGLILCMPAGGILIGKITSGMLDDDDAEEDDQKPTEEDDEAVAVAEEVSDDDDADATANAIKKAATAIETAAAAYTNSLSVASSSTTTDESLSEQDEAKIENILKGLPDGGRNIGWLERILVMLFFLSGYPQGIGFLIATKSILRFGDIKNWHQRAATEYVIIGTFLSFAWAMVIAGVTHQTLQIWFPPKPPTPTVIAFPSTGAAVITGAKDNPATHTDGTVCDPV